MRLLIPLMLLATPALAESPIQALFPSDGSCYLRHYNRSHMASHPDQMVTEIAMGPASGARSGRVVILNVQVQLRGASEIYQAAAYCENTGGAVSCGLEGDGGWFQLQPHAKGMKMTVGSMPLGFEGRNGFVTFGAEASDDDSFILPRVPADSCP